MHGSVLVLLRSLRVPYRTSCSTPTSASSKAPSPASPLWPRFSQTFGTKEVLEMRFTQLAELRNTIRHSRTVTSIVRNDGEAAISWFQDALSTRN